MRRLIILSFFIAALLSACQAQPPLATETPQPLPTTTHTPAATATAAASPTAAPSETPPVMPTSAFAPVSRADWSLGSDNATVTLIEYGDFQ